MTTQSHPSHSLAQMCHGENLTLHLSGQSSINGVIRATPDKTAALKPDLQPVPEQVTVDHHPYLDIIPFPSFRSRVLSVMVSSERALDEDALCFDLMHGGMQFNRSSNISLHGRGDGAPWDARSWEVTPWFFQKWGMLVGSENEFIYKNSAWWWDCK